MRSTRIPISENQLKELVRDTKTIQKNIAQEIKGLVDDWLNEHQNNRLKVIEEVLGVDRKTLYNQLHGRNPVPYRTYLVIVALCGRGDRQLDAYNELQLHATETEE